VTAALLWTFGSTVFRGRHLQPKSLAHQ